MRITFWPTSLLLSALFASALFASALCSSVHAATADTNDKVGAPNPNVKSHGQALYEQHCASCHNHGVSKAPDPSMLQFLATSVIHKTLTQGVMRTQAVALSDAEKVQVAEYLTQRKLTTASSQPQAPQCKGTAKIFDWSQPVSAANWGLTWGNTREVSEAAAGITAADIPKLKLKWAFAFPDAQRARSHPIVAGGAVFTGSQNGNVYALDAESGCIRWAYNAATEVRTGIAFDSATRRLFFGDLLGRVYAIDADSGKELWRIRADDHPAATITGTPTYYDGRLYVAVSSLEVLSATKDDYPCCNFRGSVVALDPSNGQTLWRTYSVIEASIAQKKNSKGIQNYGPSGAPIWNSPTIDFKRGQLYVGTGENYSSPTTRTSDAILAMDLKTGQLRWTYQATPNDAWNSACYGREKRANCPKEDGPDFDFGASMVLATTSAGRDLVLGPQKSGIVHAVDPDNGKLLWRTKVGRGGLHGGVHFGMAVSGDRAFVPISDANDWQTYTTPAKPGLYALNLIDGQFLWRAPLSDECRGREYCDVGIGAAITATPSLVFAGALDGYLRIHDAATGKVLRTLDTTAAVTSTAGGKVTGGSMDGGTGPLPFNGQLYVNSGYNFAGHMAGNVLLVYGR